MRECVKNWEDTTPGTVRGKPAHSQLQHSLLPPMDRTVYRYIQMRDLNHEIH